MPRVVAVRGLAYGDRTANARRLSVADTVGLEREPENPFDANAIRVRLADGAEVGYVAREAARGLAAHLDADPHAFRATVRDAANSYAFPRRHACATRRLLGLWKKSLFAAASPA